MRRTMIVALVLSFASVTAFAGTCPREMAKIDEATKTANLSAANKTAVTGYRKSGEDLHKAAKHMESLETLAKAKTILGIN